MDAFGWAFFGLIVVVIVGIVLVIPIAAVGVWDLVRPRGTRAARDPAVAGHDAPARGVGPAPPSRADEGERVRPAGRGVTGT